MITYEQWNKAILSHFLEEWEPGQIVFLQTNAETLGEIADKSDFNVSDAADSLKKAVQHKAIVRSTVNFWAIDPKLWIDYSKEEPPQVAFLALTVFAASLMDSEGSVISSSNYYIRLNELLFGQSFKGAPQGFNHPQFEKFWKHLQGWLHDQHDVILYLTEGVPKRRYVWYPISQCLISTRDRRIIYRFFRDYKLTPFSKISDNQLERELRAWLLRSGGSTKIERYFFNNSYRESIRNQVKSLLRHWDNEILPEPPRGERQTTASVNVEIRFDRFNNDSNDNVKIRYWFPTRGRSKIRCKTNALGIEYLQLSHLEKWFRPIPDNNGEFWNLLNRLQVQTDETNSIIYTLSLSDIWVFQKDPTRDDSWFSQRNMQLGEKHLIIFRKHFISQVMDCLGKVCEQEFERPSPIYIDGKKENWLYLEVEPTKFESFSNQKLWKLSVTAGKRLSLVGGLSVTDQNERKAYLDICLPNVFVPNLGLSDQEVLRIDEREFLFNQDRLVTLDNVLGPGVYQLAYGGQTRELRVISPERSLEHHDQTLLAGISQDQTAMPTYSLKRIEEVSEKFGLWFVGVKFFGTDIPKVSWGNMGEIPPEPPPPEPSFKVPANVISSVVQVAIDFKQGKTSVPDWFEEAIEYLEQNIALRALVEKKLNIYHEKALSYVELREQIGK